MHVRAYKYIVCIVTVKTIHQYTKIIKTFSTANVRKSREKIILIFCYKNLFFKFNFFNLSGNIHIIYSYCIFFSSAPCRYMHAAVQIHMRHIYAHVYIQGRKVRTSEGNVLWCFVVSLVRRRGPMIGRRHPSHAHVRVRVYAV